VPEEMWLSDEELETSVVAATQKVIDAGTLSAKLDGREIGNLKSFRAGPERYTYTVPEGENIYTQFGIDFSGPVEPAFSDGFWLLLPPLSPGRHTLSFGGTVPADPEAFVVEAQYELTVE
jgi:hypothetical protein